MIAVRTRSKLIALTFDHYSIIHENMFPRNCKKITHILADIFREEAARKTKIVICYIYESWGNS